MPTWGGLRRVKKKKKNVIYVLRSAEKIKKTLLVGGICFVFLGVN